jgi:hypothetical protein
LYVDTKRKVKEKHSIFRETNMMNNSGLFVRFQENPGGGCPNMVGALEKN